MSAFWLRKIETFFERIDLDRDGALTRKDFEILADCLIESGRLNETRGKELRSLLTKEWDTFFEPAAKGKPLTKEVFLELAKPMFRNTTVTELEEGMYPIVFSAIDSDGDGFINLKEYVAVYKYFGFDEKQATVAFQAMDTNADGVISLDEYCAAAMEFLNGDDESSDTKYFWGPLV